MTPPRFQFTIRGMLWATFWAGASFSAWNMDVPWVASRHYYGPTYGYGLLSEFIGIGITIARLCGPFTAIGALFGRAFWGFVVGSAALVALYTSSGSFLYVEYRYFNGGPRLAACIIIADLVAFLGLYLFRWRKPSRTQD